MMAKTHEIVFNSFPEFWNKESLGLKRNTIREEDTDMRFAKLRLWMSAKIDLRIGIKNTETGDIFHRKITDVSLFVTDKTTLYIISW